ncbi:transmembrane protein 18 [Gongronella butleri]|nr:transmembrane protein 18 [Gongronella butleri]
MDSLDALFAQVSALFKDHAHQTREFFQAVDWSQPFLVALLAFHAITLLTAVLLRHRHTALSCYFFVLLGLAGLTQPLNSLGNTHWRSFAASNYFDDSGLFIVSVYAFPLLFNGFVTLLLILKATFSLMIETKRRQLARKKKD